jgi:serine/threonine protein kinase
MTTPNPRSEQDFETLCYLGSGAFGKVYKVRNKIDGQFYALKRIRIPDNRRRDRVLREARVLSSLSHARVTRYFNCWIETVEEDVDTSTSTTASRNPHNNRINPLPTDESFTNNQEQDDDGEEEKKKKFSPSTTSSPPLPILPANDEALIPSPVSTPLPSSPTVIVPPEVICTCSICSKVYEDWAVSFLDWGKLDASLQPLNLCTDCYRLGLTKMGFDLSRITITRKNPNNNTGLSKDTGGNNNINTSTPLTPKRKTVTVSYLVIQTEFADHTLTQELDDMHQQLRTSSSSSTDTLHQRLWQLFWEIVEGLAYLHAQNVVHRDLKPSNIFVKNNSIKIGDLGLAMQASSNAATSSSSSTSSSISTPITTTSTGIRFTIKEEISSDEQSSSNSQNTNSDNTNKVIETPLRDRANGISGLAIPTLDFSNTHNNSSSSIHNDNSSPTSLPLHHQQQQKNTSITLLSRGVGTLLYMSPEAVEGIYSDKSDMYSLGVIIYEMFSGFRSIAEKVRMLDALRCGAVPRTFVEAYPIQAQLISNLTQITATSRPSASDLLRYRYFVWQPAISQQNLRLRQQQQQQQLNEGNPVSPRRATPYLHMYVPTEVPNSSSSSSSISTSTQDQPNSTDTKGNIVLSDALTTLPNTVIHDNNETNFSSSSSLFPNSTIHSSTVVPSLSSALASSTADHDPVSVSRGIVNLHYPDTLSMDILELRELLGQAFQTIQEQSMVISELRQQLQLSHNQ